MHSRFSDRQGRPNLSEAEFNARATITVPRLRPLVGDEPLAPPAASAAGASRKNNPARPSAPTRHTRQRIKTPMCRLGIQSEQRSETHWLAAAAASNRPDPVAPRRSRASLPTGFAKKNSGAAASRARMKRKPAQAGAVSDADSMHWRFFGSPRVRVRRANLRNAEHFQM